MGDLISRQNAIDAWDKLSKRGRTEFDQVLMTLPSAEPNTAIIIYNFLKKKIGSEIIDNPFEFEGWYNRMIWHVQECYRLQKKYKGGEMVEPKTGEWIDHTEDGYVECPFCHSATTCDENRDELHFCFSCGADMRGGEE